VLLKWLTCKYFSCAWCCWCRFWTLWPIAFCRAPPMRAIKMESFLNGLESRLDQAIKNGKFYQEYPCQLCYRKVQVLFLQQFLLATSLQDSFCNVLTLVQRRLKGHGNEPVFRCFCINRFGLGSLHYLSSRSDFGFEFRRYSYLKIDSPHWWVGETRLPIFFKPLNKSIVIVHYIPGLFFAKLVL
jgi:hypothetical protein